MAKKSFSKGIDSLLSDSRMELERERELERAQSRSKRHGRGEVFAQDMPERQSSKRQVGAIARTSFNLDVDLMDEIKALAHWERKSLRNVVEEALIGLCESRGRDYLATAMDCYKSSK